MEAVALSDAAAEAWARADVTPATVSIPQSQPTRETRKDRFMLITPKDKKLRLPRYLGEEEEVTIQQRLPA